MSEETLRLAREGYEAWNRHDLEALLRSTAEEWEFDTRLKVPGIERVYRGHEGLRKLFRNWYTEPWEGGLSMRIERLIELDDERVVGLITFQGRGKHSGVDVSVPYAHVLTFRDGMNVRIDGFTSWRRALEFVGLDPDEELAPTPEGGATD